MSVIDKLLARIRGVVQPTPPPVPPQEREEALIPAPAVTEPAPAPRPEPIAAAVEPPPAEEAPAIVAAGPVVVEARIMEARVAVEEAPSVALEPLPDVEPTVAVAPPGGLTLRLETERSPRSTFEVTKSGATIGRGPESTIQLADLSVSRKHAKITYKQGAYWLSDLGSMGGTWIDGAKLAAPRRVATGQTIDIGLCRLTVVAAAEGEESGAVKGRSNAV